jgi:hypothetical protein
MESLQCSSVFWISKVQRRIWEITWQMWQHQNNVLHNEGQTIHVRETIALVEEIRHKIQLGLNDLDD